MSGGAPWLRIEPVASGRLVQELGLIDRRGTRGVAVVATDGPGRPATQKSEHRAVVQIYGEEYTLRGDAQPGYMEDLANSVDGRMREVAKSHPRLGTAQVAVLVAVNLMDEYVRLDEQYRRILGLLEREWDKRRGELRSEAAPTKP